MAAATSIPPVHSPRAPCPPQRPTPPSASPAPPSPDFPTSLASRVAPPHGQQRNNPQPPHDLRALTHLPRSLLAAWRSHPLWRNTDFLVLVAGQAVSIAGNGASTLALPLLVLWLTHSVMQAGLLGAVRLIPYAALALPAGAWVDHCDRKRLMIACDAGRAVLMGSVPLVVALTGHLWLSQLYLVSLGEGILFVFFDLAETASTVQVVGREALPDAVAVSTTVANSAQLAGPLVGGALYAVGRLVPLAVDALTYGASVLSLTQIRASFQATPAAHAPQTTHARPKAAKAASAVVLAPSAPPAEARQMRQEPFRSSGATPRRWHVLRPSHTLRRQSTGRWGTFWGEARVGLTLVWGHPTLRALLLLGAVWNTVVTGFSLLVVVRAQALHANSPVVGLVLAAAGAGSVIGPVVGAPFSRRLGLARVALGGAFGEALLWPLLGWAGTPLALAGVVALLMASDQIFNVAQYTWRLSLLPTAGLGRATATFRLALLGTQPLGLMLMGLLLTRWGPAPTALWCGVALLGATGALAWHVMAPTGSSTGSLSTHRRRPWTKRAQSASSSAASNARPPLAAAPRLLQRAIPTRTHARSPRRVHR